MTTETDAAAYRLPVGSPKGEAKMFLEFNVLDQNCPQCKASKESGWTVVSDNSKFFYCYCGICDFITPYFPTIKGLNLYVKLFRDKRQENIEKEHIEHKCEKTIDVVEYICEFGNAYNKQPEREQHMICIHDTDMRKAGFVPYMEQISIVHDDNDYSHWGTICKGVFVGKENAKKISIVRSKDHFLEICKSFDVKKEYEDYKKSLRQK